MLITREADYALRIMRALSLGVQLTAGELSRGEQIPEQFAYKILKKLEQAFLLEISRGKVGGCRLTADLHTVTLYDLLMAVGVDSGINLCTMPGHTCAWSEAHKESCAMRHQLLKVQETVNQELKSYSLHDMFHPVCNDPKV